MAYQSRSRSNTQTARVASVGSGAARDTRQIVAAEGIVFPVIVWVAHLLIVQVVATLANWLGSTNPNTSEPFFWRETYPGGPPVTGAWSALVEPLARWDGLWYRAIAQFGYASCSPPECDGPYNLANSNPAFWPLYPWLMRFGEWVTGLQYEVVGWIISSLAFLVALVCVYALVRLDFDRAVARRTLWALALFPTALFFSAVYTEALFLALAAGAMLAARTRNWLVAGIIGALAALTRSQGVLLLAPFAVLFLQQYGWNPRRWFPNAAFAALPALGPLIFMWGLERQGIDRLAFVNVQEQWWRFSAMPWETIQCAVAGCVRPVTFPNFSDPAYQINGANWGWVSTLASSPTWTTFSDAQFRSLAGNSRTLELICAVLFFTLAIIGLRYLPLAYSAYIWPPLLIPLFSPSAINPLMSIPRFGLVLFPLFVVLALLFDRARFAVPVLIASALLLALFTAQFANWYWVS